MHQNFPSKIHVPKFCYQKCMHQNIASRKGYTKMLLGKKRTKVLLVKKVYAKILLLRKASIKILFSYNDI